jgi:hypothetical protein
MSAESLTRAVLTEDDRALIERPGGSYRPAPCPRTDWDQVQPMIDDAIQAAAASDPDALPLDEAFWREARVVFRGQVRKRHTGRASMRMCSPGSTLRTGVTKLG